MKDVWVEKYRPKTLSEVVGQEETVERLKAYVKAHKGNGEFFGLPSYVAAQVDTLAVTRACKAGHG